MDDPMLRLAAALGLAAACAVPAVAQTTVPDLRGTWKGNSESVVWGGGNPHHGKTAPSDAQFRTVPFTLVVDKQEGRRFAGTFSSSRSNEKVVAVISRNGQILLADDDGYTIGSILAPDRIELCYLKTGKDARVASCTELTKQP
jgi:hypothetical protein